MVLTDYLYWHYAIAPRDILGLLKNYLLGISHRFLIVKHLKTLFAPWHRAKPSDMGRPSTFGDKIINVIVDFYIRILAAIIRLTIIIIGLIVEVVIIIAFVALLIVWLLWPAIFVYLISRGLSLAF